LLAQLTTRTRSSPTENFNTQLRTKLLPPRRQDALSGGGSYRLRDTGQGLNRVQPAPRLRPHMDGLIKRAAAEAAAQAQAQAQAQAHVQVQVHAQWVGSAVVHLGDHCVPNALIFLDKYIQVMGAPLFRLMTWCSACLLFFCLVIPLVYHLL
jgi:hypothetical protein